VKLRALCLVLLLGLCARPVVASPIISVQPDLSTVSLGSSFFLDINIADVSDLFGFQFDLFYDPAMLTATDIVNGGFFADGDSFFIPGAIDDLLGTIAFTASTLLGPIVGVDGSGTLARVSFKAKSSGTSAVGLTSVLLLDSGLSEIAADAQGGSVKVNAGDVAPVPEPTSVVLFGSALVAMWRGRRRITCAA
jgi:Cohesin domain/PEP-CTERM motif